MRPPSNLRHHLRLLAPSRALPIAAPPAVMSSFINEKALAGGRPPRPPG
uniref:Uncharacterized protein n=1 Tax=Arundo donax TaxID=35708 RepID=A0A0A8YUX5_ARUDO